MVAFTRNRSLGGGQRLRAFTLIEVLVVVAIIALLIAILLPSLKLAKERARAAVCLSNLKQQGVGYSTYSVDHKGVLPRAAKQFKYCIQEGADDGQGGDMIGVAGGALYGKYVGMAIGFLYCPSNTFNEKSLNPNLPGYTWERLFRENYLYPEKNNSHDTQYHVATNYLYAVPAAPGTYPLDKGKDIYREAMCTSEVDKKTKQTKIKPWNYYLYMTDPADQSDAEANAFLGHFHPGSRGASAVKALSCDAYFGAGSVPHPDGPNVLYSDFHARMVPDPKKRIIKGSGLSGGIRNYATGNVADAKAFIVWDYLSRNP